MSVGLDPAGAPGFIGPTPPNRVAQTLPEIYQLALDHLSSTNLSDEDLRASKVFMIGFDQIVKQKLQQQGGQLLPEEGGPAPAGVDEGEEEDYGAGAGEPVELGD